MHRRTWRRAKARPLPWMSASSSQVAGSRPYFTEPHPSPMNKRQTLAPTARRWLGPARCARPDAVRHPSREEVVAATDGPTQAADTLRTTLAMGAVHFLHEPEGPARPLLPLAKVLPNIWAASIHFQFLKCCPVLRRWRPGPSASASGRRGWLQVKTALLLCLLQANLHRHPLIVGCHMQGQGGLKGRQGRTGSCATWKL